MDSPLITIIQNQGIWEELCGDLLGACDLDGQRA